MSPPTGRPVISLGAYVDSDLPVYLDLDHLLGKHTALVGTTGCGKSYTVARLVHRIVEEYPAANIIVFDLHGEYKNCFAPCKHIRADQLSSPHGSIRLTICFDYVRTLATNSTSTINDGPLGMEYSN